MSYQEVDDDDERIIWKREATISLCKLVRPHKLIYDQRHPLYMKTKQRQKIFREIVIKLLQMYPYMEGLTPDLCREKFKVLKAYFRREFKKNCYYEYETSKWELYEYLEYLDDPIRAETTSSSMIQGQDKDYADDDSNPEIDPDTQSKDLKNLYVDQINNLLDTPQQGLEGHPSSTHEMYGHSSKSHESPGDRHSEDKPKKRKYNKAPKPQDPDALAEAEANKQDRYKKIDEADQKRSENLERALESMINMAKGPLDKSAETIAEAAAMTLKATINEFPAHKQYDVAARIMSVIFKIKDEMNYQNPTSTDPPQFKQL